MLEAPGAVLARGLEHVRPSRQATADCDAERLWTTR